MANQTTVITITSARAVPGLAKSSSDPRGECRSIKHFFERAESGIEPISFYSQSSTSAPVRATNTLTLTYSSISNNDTAVVAGTTLTCVTGTPSGGAQFKKQTDATVTAANLVACVNANTTLNKLMTASNVAGVVTFTLHVPGVIGNQVPLVGSTGMVVGAATFASGAGGSEVAPVIYSRGL